MAGQTKLIGFNLSDGKVQLMRWGETADFKISDKSVAELDRVCRDELPKRPETPATPESSTGFDSVSGNIILSMSPEDGEMLCTILESINHGAAKGLEADERKLVDSWTTAINQALETRKSWFDAKDEPGVD